MILPITLTMAGACALINIWLAARCVRGRFGLRVEHGDGGHQPMLVRIRSHGNFTEYSPIFLILLGLIEYARGPMLWLWIAGIVFIIARIAHPFGMERRSPNILRGGGMVLTFAVILVLAAYALYLPYSAL